MEGLDPRQIEFLKNFTDPNSETYADALNSGKKAGFSDSYAKNILSLMPDWLSTCIEDAQLVTKALRNLNNLLESEDERVSADITKFTLTRLNKKKFSEKTEVEHSGTVVTGFNYINNETDNTSNEEARPGVEETA